MHIAIMTFDGFNVEEAAFHAGGCLGSQYLATWMMCGAGLNSATQALHCAAPVGEKSSYVTRLLKIVEPFVPPPVNGPTASSPIDLDSGGERF